MQLAFQRSHPKKCPDEVPKSRALATDPRPVRRSERSNDCVTRDARRATRESWKDASGNKVERTEWHRVVIWNEGLGDIAEKYLVKGAKVYVEGKLPRIPAPSPGRE